MPRSQLMSRVLRLARDVYEADDTGKTVERVRAERQGRVSRRDFLKGTGAAAAGLALAGPGNLLRAAAAPRQPGIAVIGAGIAGLSAALELQDHSVGCTIFEASDHVGGRMHSMLAGQFWQNGQTSEWCGELIDTNHKTIQQLAQRFNLPLVDMIAAQPAGSEDTYWVHGHYYPWQQAAADFQPVAATLKQQLHDAPFPTLYNSFTAFGQFLDNMTAYQWIESYVPGGHASDLGALLDNAYNNEYGLDTTQQSALNMLYLLAYMPAQPSVGAFDWYGVSDERFHIVGGNQQLPMAIANRLQTVAPMAPINFNWRMTAIAANADGTVTCTFATPSGTVSQTFAHVIVTTPFSVLRGLDYSRAGFDDRKKTAITQLGYGTNTKFNLQFKSRFWNGTGAWPGVSDGTIYTDLPMNNTWEATRGASGATGVVVIYTGGNVGASIKLAQPYSTTASGAQVTSYVNQYLKQLDTIWPGAAKQYNGLATSSTPWSDPNLLGSYSCWKLGQYTTFSGYEGVAQGSIHFAGEHCSINFQGFMEGGASEGRRAAHEVLVAS